MSAVFVSDDGRPQGARYWAIRALQGFIVGGAIATLDFLYYAPLVAEPRTVDFALFLSSLVVWGGECVLFGLVLGLAERAASPNELRAWQLALAIVAGVAVSVVVWHAFTLLVLRDQFGMRLFREEAAGSVDWKVGVLYHVWLMLFFGGLTAVVTASQRRRTRMLAALRAAELGRATSQQRLAQARLGSLEARVDPDHVYRSLSRLERLYEYDPPAADRLLDELIAFLRSALAEGRRSTSKEAV